jgi:hypothetical protein
MNQAVQFRSATSIDKTSDEEDIQERVLYSASAVVGVSRQLVRRNE